MERFEKKSYEEFTIETDFSQNLFRNTIIIKSDIFVYNNTGENVTDEIIKQNSLYNDDFSVFADVKSGNSFNSPYKIIFRCETSVGDRWEHQIMMTVNDF